MGFVYRSCMNVMRITSTLIESLVDIARGKGLAKDPLETINRIIRFAKRHVRLEPEAEVILSGNLDSSKFLTQRYSADTGKHMSTSLLAGCFFFLKEFAKELYFYILTKKINKPDTNGRTTWYEHIYSLPDSFVGFLKYFKLLEIRGVFKKFYFFIFSLYEKISHHSHSCPHRRIQCWISLMACV